MQPTLYYSPGASSLAAHIVLEELGHPFRLSLVSTADGSTRSPEHLCINPKGRIPVLRIDDRILTELPAILLFLALSNPGASLAPVSPEGLARCVEWFNWLSGTVHSVAIRQVWRPEDFSTDKTQTDNVIATGKKSLSEAFEYVEERMQGSDWAVGQQYSIVDPFLLVIHYWGSQIGFDMAGRYSAWTNHARRVLRRPAVQRALAHEAIDAWT